MEWTGLRVCEFCHDPKPAQLSPPNIKPEGLPLPNAAPQPADIFIEDSQPVTGKLDFSVAGQSGLIVFLEDI